MKSSESSNGFKPFENLQSLLEGKLSANSIQKKGSKYARSKNPDASTPPYNKKSETHPEHETELFMQAMRDVTPISKGRHLDWAVKPRKPAPCQHNTDSEILKRLNKLVSCGEGFVVADTPEYMEGTGYNVNPAIMKALHRGDFSIQAHIDLHGLTVSKAKACFDAFFKDSIRTCKRGILVIHGRGLSSPKEPVLKLKVYEWLTNRPWRKWIIAFTSARTIDGGAGATYVLLRRNPTTKRLIKKKRPSSNISAVVCKKTSG